MPSLSIALWMLKRVQSTPIGWLWIASALLGVPILKVLTPEGVVGHAEGSGALVQQVAFLASMTGAMLALAGLARSDWMLELCDPATKLRAQAAGLATAALLGAGAVVLGSAGFDHHGEALSLNALLPALLTTAHLAAVGTALLQVPRLANWTPLGLPVFVWILPATLPPEAWPWLQDLLRAPREVQPWRDWTPAGFLGSVGPILVWAALAWLLTQGRSRPLRPTTR